MSTQATEDLVVLLRARAQYNKSREGFSPVHWDLRIEAEAADEIERLRFQVAEVAHLVRPGNGYVSAYDLERDIQAIEFILNGHDRLGWFTDRE